MRTQNSPLSPGRNLESLAIIALIGYYHNRTDRHFYLLDVALRVAGDVTHDWRKGERQGMPQGCYRLRGLKES